MSKSLHAICYEQIGVCDNITLSAAAKALNSKAEKLGNLLGRDIIDISGRKKSGYIGAMLFIAGTATIITMLVLGHGGHCLNGLSTSAKFGILEGGAIINVIGMFFIRYWSTLYASISENGEQELMDDYIEVLNKAEQTPELTQQSGYKEAFQEANFYYPLSRTFQSNCSQHGDN